MNTELIFSITGCIIGIIAIVLILVTRSKNGESETTKEITSLKGKIDFLSQNTSTNFDNMNSNIHSITENVNTKILDMTKSNYESQNQLMTVTKNTLSQIIEINTKENEKLRLTLENSIDKIISNNEKKLEEMRITVDEKLSSTLTQRLDSSFKTVSEQLGNVYKSLGEMQTLSQGVTSLNKVFSNVKSRGTWAEYQLENILDQTIPGMYVKNYHPSVTKDVVEFAVKIPSGEDKTSFTFLPIDSKFPLEDYVRLCDAIDSGDTDNIARCRKALEDSILLQAKKINKYICVPETTPFAILYVATEGLYAEIVSSKTGILEKLQSQYNISVAGPTTVTALLNSLAMGFKSIAVNEKAAEIREILGIVKAQYDDFNTILEKIKKKIGETDSSIDSALKRNNIIRKKLKNVDAIEGTQADTFLFSEE